MRTRILLIAPDAGFGELIRQALVEAGRHDVDLVPNGIAALARAQSGEFDLTILDCAAEEVPAAELVNTLRDWHPALRLVLIPPDNDSAHPALADVNPDAYLTKPFYLPEMVDLVAGLLGDERVEPQEAQVPDRGPLIGEDLPIPWLDNVDQAAQYLARLTLETAAKAALIVRDEQLWAYAGELEHPAGDQLAASVGRQWGSQKGNDLARFVTLDDGQEYMLYATDLEEGLVLALIFDARTPFSKIRTQSSQLARALSSGPEEPDDPGTHETGVLEPALQGNGAQDSRQPQDDPEAGRAPLVGLETAPRRLEVAEGLEALEAESLPMDWLPGNLPEDWGLLEEIEEAMEAFSIPTDWQPRHETSAGPRAYLEELLGEPIPSVKLPYQRAGGASAEASPGIFDESPLYPPPESMAETRPTRVPAEEPMIRLEPESASFFSVTFACVLLPRMPEHHLVSELAKHLEEWMFQICVSFDWRLEQLAIRPTYMQWMVRAHAATAPRFLMQIITRLTSQRIFERFPRYAAENPSGEFWAPGWLVITSEQLPPPQMVQEFIANTRARQGVGE